MKQTGKKLLSYLLILAMVVGLVPGMRLTAYAASSTVTWNASDITGEGDSFTKDGVTVTAGLINYDHKIFEDDGTFTTTLGNFTKIEVSTADFEASGTGWSGTTWTGNASSVSFSGDLNGVTKIVFTIETPTVAVESVNLNQTALSLTAGGDTATLTATVSPDGATDKTVTWTTSDASIATVDNGVVTPKAAGTATITATATNGTEDTSDDKTATCTVTVSDSQAALQNAQSALETSILEANDYATSIVESHENEAVTVWNSVETATGVRNNATSVEELQSAKETLDKVVAKTKLEISIEEAESYYNDIQGSHADAAATLLSAITTAKAVKDNTDATVQELTEAKTALDNALATAQAQAAAAQQSDKYTFYVTDSLDWGSACAYAWDSDGNALLGEWPGTAVSTGTTELGDTQFIVQLPKTAAGFIVNNGGNAQTEDITNFSYDGFWMDGSKNALGHYLVTGYNFETTEPEPPAPADTYVVAGSKDDIFGSTWDGTSEANKMTLANGTYTKSYTVDQAYDGVQLKVVKNGTTWIGDQSGNNVTFNLTGAGTFTVSYNPSTNAVSVSGDIVASESAETVTYTDANGEHTCTVLDANSTTWTDGWYIVKAGETVTIPAAVTVSGDVHLVLQDGATLNTQAGIAGGEGSLLTVEGSGALNAAAEDGSNAIVIDQLTVNGGSVTVNTDQDGIVLRRSAAITGGTVNVTAANGDGISVEDRDGNLTISGGSVEVRGKQGIGVNGQVAVSGGTVHAVATGTGEMDSAIVGVGGITVSGGSVTAEGISIGLLSYDNVQITDGSVTASGSTAAYSNNVSVSGGDVTATGSTNGLAAENSVSISGGDVTATGSAYGLAAMQSVSIQGGTVTATTEGEEGAVYGTTVTVAEGLTVTAGDDATSAAAVSDFATNHSQKYVHIEAPQAAETVTYGEHTCTVLGANSTSLTAGWYIVKEGETVTIPAPVAVSGDVHLVLQEGATLNTLAGIAGAEGSLTVEGSGELNATAAETGSTEDESYAIVIAQLTVNGGSVSAGGGDDAILAGNLTINGGSVTVNTDKDGILLTQSAAITGGTVNVTANGEGISSNQSDCNLTISGGSVEVTGDQAISFAGQVAVSGGTVHAVATGTDMDDSAIYGGAITVSGGSVTAEGVSLGLYSEGNVQITDGSVTASGSMAALGYDVEISGGDVTATGGSMYGLAANNNVSISGGNVTATGDLGAVYCEKGVTVAEGLAVTAGDDAASAAAVSDFATNHSQKYVHIEAPQAAETVTYGEHTCTVLGANSTSLTDGWYIVKEGETVTIPAAVTVSGDVHLVLQEGATLNTQAGIAGAEGSLTVEGSGTLNAAAAETGSTEDESYAIVIAQLTVNGGSVSAGGGDQAILAGNLTINGGSVTVNTDKNGIEVIQSATITGGTVNVTANRLGISSQRGGITISGGSVDVTGDQAIYFKGLVAVSGGTVHAVATGNAVLDSAIVGEGGITVSGGSVTAQGNGYGLLGYSKVLITDGSVTASGSIAAYSFDVEISGGDVTANGSTYGLAAMDSMSISGGNVTATGEQGAVYCEKGVTVAEGLTVKAGSDAASAAAVSDFATNHSQKYVHIEAAAEPVNTTGTIVMSEQGFYHSQTVGTITKDGITVVAGQGNGSNSPKYYVTGQSLYVYGGNTLTVSVASGTITQIVFTYGSGDGTNEITADSGTFDTNTWTGSAQSVTFTVGGTSGHRRIKEIAVTYGASATVTDYPLVIGGVFTNSENLSGEGWSFTPAEGENPATLTLNNYNNNGAVYNYMDVLPLGILWLSDEPLTVQLAGENTVTAGDGIGIEPQGAMSITGDGKLTVQGGMGSLIASFGQISISGGANVAASGPLGADVVIESGSLDITSGADFTIGSNITIGENGRLTAVNTSAEGTLFYSDEEVTCLVTNAVPGIGWTNAEGTEGETSIEISTTGQALTFKKVQFPAPAPAVATVDGTSYSSFAEALSAWAGGAGTTLTLAGDVTVDSTIEIRGTKTLDLNGYGIKRTGSGTVLEISDGASLTLNDSTPARTDTGDNRPAGVTGGYITGGTGTDVYGGLVIAGGVYNAGTFTMNGGSITGNSANLGGGVYNAGTFTMNGGSITGNSGANYGGGVCNDFGEFTMTGGSITGNSGNLGGGVMNSYGTLNLSGAPVITGNTGSDLTNITASVAVTGALTGEGPIRVMVLDSEGAPTSGSFAQAGGNYSLTDADAAKFTSDLSDYVVKRDGNTLLLASAHTHSFSYSASGDTVTATCTADGCDNPAFSAALTVTAPTLTTYGGTGDAAATLTGLDAFNTATEKTVSAADILYVGRNDTTYEESATAPTAAGQYTAKLTVEGQTAQVDYEIGKAAGSISYASTALGRIYGAAPFTNTLTNTGDGTVSYASDNTAVATVDATGAVTIVGAGNATITATVTDGANYTYAKKTASYTLYVGALSMTVSATPYSGSYDGESHGISVSVTTPADGYTVKYGTAAGSYTLDESPSYTDVGTYTVYYQVTANGYTEVNDSSTVTISKATPSYTVPSGLTATYGQTLADVSLPEGWSWKDNTQSVGNAGSNSFQAVFTPADTTNYNVVNDVDVTVTVEKAANPATVAGTATVIKGGNTLDLSANVTMNGATGAVGYELSDNAPGCTLSGSILTTGENTGSVTVNVTVAADANYNAMAATPITVTVTDKLTQTISAENVTLTYGDTGKSVSASVTDPATGGGAIRYAVKTGSEDTIGVNAETGALTVIKAGTATVIVTAAETQTHAQATRELTVTVNKANPSETAPTGLTATYGDTLAAVTLPEGWSWKDSTQSVGNAGSNSFQAVFTPSDTVNYNVLSDVDVTVNVNRAAITPTVSLAGWVYGQSANTPVVGGNTGNGTETITYAVRDSGNFAATQPTDAGSYTVKLEIAQTANYLGGTATADFTITPAALTVTATGYTGAYDGQSHGIGVDVGDSGASVYYAATELSAANFATAGSTTAPSYSDVGEYTVYYYVYSRNYTPDVAAGSQTVNIEQAAAPAAESLTDAQKPAAKAELIADGSEQPLVTAPTLPEGYTKVLYSTDGGATWTETVPTGKDPGDYSVQVKYVGDKNHSDFEGETVNVTVGSLTVSFADSDVAAQSVIRNGKLERPANPSREGYAFDGWFEDATCTVPYDFNKTVTGNVTLYAKWTPNVYQLTNVTGATTDANHIWYKQSGTDTVTNNNTGVEVTVKLTNGPDDSFNHFTGVQLDGVPLTRDVDYAARAGSTVVTLFPATLRRLSNGAHTLTVLFDNNSVSTRLTVRQNSSTPATGDQSSAALYLTILVLSALGMAAVTVESKKRRTAKR